LPKSRLIFSHEFYHKTDLSSEIQMQNPQLISASRRGCQHFDGIVLNLLQGFNNHNIKITRVIAPARTARAPYQRRPSRRIKVSANYRRISKRLAKPNKRGNRVIPAPDTNKRTGSGIDQIVMRWRPEGDR
jgi:hypothetical protein